MADQGYKFPVRHSMKLGELSPYYLYDERNSAKSTRRKNACGMHTAPDAAKKIMLL
jgi:hypothetical protein